jgi:hypothetical protein
MAKAFAHFTAKVVVVRVWVMLLKKAQNLFNIFKGFVK